MNNTFPDHPISSSLRRRLSFFVLLFAVFLLISCWPQRHASIHFSISEPSYKVQLNDWEYIVLDSATTGGDIALEPDQLHGALAVAEASYHPGVGDNLISFGKQIFNTHSHLRGVKKSEESIIDFDDIPSTELSCAVMYLTCEIIAEQAAETYILFRSTDGIKLWVNGKEILYTNEHRGFEQSFSDFARIHLTRGSNRILVKKVVDDPKVVFEAVLTDRASAWEEYKKCANGLLFEEGISEDFFHIRGRNTFCFAPVVKYEFRDIYNKTVSRASYGLKSADTVGVSSVKSESAYMCYGVFNGLYVRQPVFVGDPEKYLKKLRVKCKGFAPTKQQRLAPYLFRLNELLIHESKNSDWWWSFKVAAMIYEIEAEVNAGSDEQLAELSFGIQLKAYKSQLDNSTQHYLMVTPDAPANRKKMPLVLVVRPFIENHHHFLTSPQMARHWALLWAKNMSNKYGYAIAMPSARMFGYEALTPMAEAEMLQVLREVQANYNIDDDRIYLHANCSAGYRSLVLAGHQPGIFAAAGLYAPTVKADDPSPWMLANSPMQMLDSLQRLPALIHYDLADKHNPYSEFKDFIVQSNQRRLPLVTSNRKHSGLHYNVQLVGEEALEFFKDKVRTQSRVHLTTGTSPKKKPDNQVLLDFFSEPYIFVTSEEIPKNSNKLESITRSIVNEYEEQLFSKCPIKHESQITLQDLTTKNLFLIGHHFKNKRLTAIVNGLPIRVSSDHVVLKTRTYHGSDITFASIFSNPQLSEHKVIVYSSNQRSEMEHKIKSLWRDGQFDTMTR